MPQTAIVFYEPKANFLEFAKTISNGNEGFFAAVQEIAWREEENQQLYERL
ncbi:hypothetical protein [Adlercreutzia sp. ZJ242]|uniref:hypothetical protein n=1 Tax=Adlercreutzia sp. ZJ242 TaxID=2709409 RepID=UPI00197F7531|nr:hypothetical protein [Adlercreutzia sp. ZJ242]